MNIRANISPHSQHTRCIADNRGVMDSLSLLILNSVVLFLIPAYIPFMEFCKRIPQGILEILTQAIKFALVKYPLAYILTPLKPIPNIANGANPTHAMPTARNNPIALNSLISCWSGGWT